LVFKKKFKNWRERYLKEIIIDLAVEFNHPFFKSISIVKLSKIGLKDGLMNEILAKYHRTAKKIGGKKLKINHYRCVKIKIQKILHKLLKASF